MGYRVSQSEWSAEFQFRASGPERAGGILQLWYTKDGQSRIGTSSIYTVGQFDGFALVIDTHGGRVCINPVAYCCVLIITVTNLFHRVEVSVDS